jgi:hypothetical protein
VPMSALGQKQTYALQQAMSALHPIATAKAKFHKRRESEIPQKAMSALPPKADMCGATICALWAISGHQTYSNTSSARAITDGGTVRPIALAVLTLTAKVNFVGACTGRLVGFSPLRMRST